jgi:hypothetical protein
VAEEQEEGGEQEEEDGGQQVCGDCVHVRKVHVNVLGGSSLFRTVQALQATGPSAEEATNDAPVGEDAGACVRRDVATRVG